MISRVEEIWATKDIIKELKKELFFAKIPNKNNIFLFLIL